MKVALIFVLGLYGLAVTGTWLGEQATPSGAGAFRTLHDLQSLEQRYLQDYQLYCASQLPESVILQEEQQMRALRAKLIVRVDGK